MSSFSFVSGQHPDFDICLLKVSDTISDIVLQEILQASDSKESQVSFKDSIIYILAILLRIILIANSPLGKHEGSQTFSG